MATIYLNGAIEEAGAWDFFLDEKPELINVKTVKEALSGKKEDIFVSLNTHGGDVFHAITVYNYIRDWKKTTGKTATVFINGLVASAGVYLLGAFDKIVSSDNSILMTHEIQVTARGSVKDFEGLIDQMKSIQGVIAKEYQKITGKNEAETNALLENETFFYGNEIHNFGWSNEHESHIDSVEPTSYNNKAINYIINKFQSKPTNEKNLQQLKNYLILDDFSKQINNKKPLKTQVENAKLDKDTTADNGVKKMDKDEIIKNLTLSDIKNHRPDLFESIYNDGKKQGFSMVNSHLKWVEKGLPLSVAMENIKNEVEINSEIMNDYVLQLTVQNKTDETIADQQADPTAPALNQQVNNAATTGNPAGFGAIFNQFGE